jgi:hypothetical protein
VRRCWRVSVVGGRSAERKLVDGGYRVRFEEDANLLDPPFATFECDLMFNPSPNITDQSEEI